MKGRRMERGKRRGRGEKVQGRGSEVGRRRRRRRREEELEMNAQFPHSQFNAGIRLRLVSNEGVGDDKG